MVIKDFIFWIIPIVVLILLAVIYFGPESGFEQLKEVVSDLKTYGPDVSLGQSQVGAQQILTSQRAEEANSFVDSLRRVSASPHQNCIGKIQDLSDLEEQEGFTRIRLSHHPVENGDNTSVIIESSKGTAVYEVARMKPCVIAGAAAPYFFTGFITKLDSTPLEPYTLPVQTIELYHNTAGWNGNVIRVPELGANIVNDEADNFQSAGYVFKGKGNEICFFPTNDVINVDEDGIDDDYITDMGITDSIAAQYARGEQVC